MSTLINLVLYNSRIILPCSDFTALATLQFRFPVDTLRAPLFLVLDSSVLEPDLHLFFAQVQTRGNLDPTKSRQIFVFLELSLQLQELSAAEGGPEALAARSFVGDDAWTG